MEKIAALVNDKKLTGVADLRDESDRNGVRVVSKANTMIRAEKPRHARLSDELHFCSEPNLDLSTANTDRLGTNTESVGPRPIFILGPNLKSLLYNPLTATDPGDRA